MFTIELAGIPIALDNRYPFVERMCQDYLTDAHPLFTVSASEEEIDKECENVRRVNGLTDDLPRGYLESIVLYRQIAKHLPTYDAFVFHGVALEYEGEAYLFTARSGVGKTTHTRLWLSRFGERVKVLNGDKPILRLVDGVPFVFGSPWQGKENYGYRGNAPLKALAFVHRSPENRAETVTDPSSVILPFLSQTYVPQHEDSVSRVFAITDTVLKTIRLCHLYVNMEIDAAEVAFGAMVQDGRME